MELKLISLGAWCRPAHQIRVFAADRLGAGAEAYPFDWTITSFRALQNCLDQSFDPTTVLANGKTSVSFSGSGVCQKTGLIFHHAIDPASVKALGNFAVGDTLPETPEARQLQDNARSRFIHTFKRLKSLRNHSGEMVFVRWLREGQPDKMFPGAFEGESIDGLSAAIKGFLGHARFRLLVVESRVTQGRLEPFTDPIEKLQTGDGGFRCTIRERKGWNGDQTNHFRGDENSWGIALEHALKHWGIAPKNGGEPSYVSSQTG